MIPAKAPPIARSVTALSPRSTRAVSGLTARGMVRSEWIKLRTLRSTVWCFAIIIALSLGLAALTSSTIFVGSNPSSEMQQFVVTETSTFGLYFGQMIVAVLGVLVISGEYSTGMIRSTLTAVPQRIPALAAKAFVLFVTTFLVGAVSTFGSFLFAAPILATRHITADLSDGSMLSNLLLAALYLALVAVFAFGLGAILRSSAGGIAAALGIVLFLPIVLHLIAGLTQAQWPQDVLPYLLSEAGAGMFNAVTGGVLEQWQDILVVLLWVAVSIVGGALFLKRRDA
jgi:ABC-2 type transport system permease protein